MKSNRVTFNTKGTPSGSKFTPRANANRGAITNSSSGLRSSAYGASSGKELAVQSEKSKPAISSSTSMTSTAKTSGIQCFKCGGRGHVIRECPNNRTIIVNDQGQYESASDEEQEVIDGGELEDATKNEAHTSSEFEGGAALVVTQILSVQIKEAENGQRHNLFQTRAKIEGKVCKVIIDGGSCHNLASKEMVDKLGLKLLKQLRFHRDCTKSESSIQSW